MLKLLRFKVETMESTDKFSVLSYVEMCINEQLDYENNSGQFSASKSLLGQKLFVVDVRGIKNWW